MTHIYSAADYREKLRTDPDQWSGRATVVRDANGGELARGCLIGLRGAYAGGRSEDRRVYAFAATPDGPSADAQVLWAKDQTVEVLANPRSI